MRTDEDELIEARVGYQSHRNKVWAFTGFYVIGFILLGLTIGLPIEYDDVTGPTWAAATFAAGILIINTSLMFAYFEMVLKQENPKLAYLKAKHRANRSRG